MPINSFKQIARLGVENFSLNKFTLNSATEFIEGFSLFDHVIPSNFLKI